MANPNLTMPKLKRAFQLLAANVPQRTIANSYTWDAVSFPSTRRPPMK